jgi:hypothetical protein
MPLSQIALDELERHYQSVIDPGVLPSVFIYLLYNKVVDFATYSCV